MSPAASVMAATTEASGGMAVADGLQNGDLVDHAQKGSLTIFKYDITTAEKDGAYTAGTYKATGEADSRVEQALKGYGIEGVQFSLRKVGNAETRSVTGQNGTTIQLVYEIPSDLMKILGLKETDAIDMTSNAAAHPCANKGICHFSSEQISDALQKILTDDNVSAKNDLENYLYDYGTLDSTVDQKGKDGVIHLPKTDSRGYATVDGLDLELYLVVETEVPENVTATVNPWFMQLPFTDSEGEQWKYDMTCYPKNQTGNPTLDKSVRNAENDENAAYGNTATASEGDNVEYTLQSKLPHITSQATYISEYTFTDRLSGGLSYNRDVKVAFYDNAVDAQANQLGKAILQWEPEDGTFQEAYTEPTAKDPSSKLTVSLTEKGLAEINGAGKEKEGYGDYYMVVSYSAAVHSDPTVVLGDEGNPNDVQLTWSRTSDSYYNTLEDRNYVYAYGLDLTKEFSDHNGSFEKVSFNLYNVTDDCYVVAEMGDDGAYHVVGEASGQDEATGFVPGKKDGKLYIRGMEADQYQLVETATDAGYSLLEEPINITITATDRDIIPSSVESPEMFVGEIRPAEAAVDGEKATMKSDGDSVHAKVVLSVMNSKGFRLPQTGGSGLFGVTLLGMLSVVSGCAMIGKKKKQQ